MIKLVEKVHGNAVCYIDTTLHHNLFKLNFKFGDWIQREDVLEVEGLPDEIREWVKTNEYRQYYFNHWDLIQIHFEIHQYDDEEEEEEYSEKFVSVGTFTTNDSYKRGKYGSGSDVETLYISGEMGMQHESVVMYDVIEWAAKNEIDPNVRYVFEVNGYKGDLKHIGEKPYKKNSMPLNKTTLSTLIRAYIGEQDTETLKKMFEYLTIKGYRHGEIEAKVEENEIVFPEKGFDEFLDEYKMRKRC
jgi:hypothetical protein